jgi:hypothetical protein
MAKILGLDAYSGVGVLAYRLPLLAKNQHFRLDMWKK